MVNHSTNINKTNNNLSPKKALTVMVNNFTNINKTNISFILVITNIIIYTHLSIKMTERSMGKGYGV